MRNCARCMWAIWDYGGMQCVDCMACGDEKCPTDEDIEAAEKGGYLAFYGCHDIVEEGGIENDDEVL